PRRVDDPLAQRILTWKKLTRQRFVDDDRPHRPLIVCRAEVPPLQQWNPHRGEVVGADRSRFRAGSLLVRNEPPHNLETVTGVGAAEREDVDAAYRTNAWQRPKTAVEILVESGLGAVRVLVELDRELEGQDLRRVEPWVHRRELPEAS